MSTLYLPNETSIVFYENDPLEAEEIKISTNMVNISHFANVGKIEIASKQVLNLQNGFAFDYSIISYQIFQYNLRCAARLSSVLLCRRANTMKNILLFTCSFLINFTVFADHFVVSRDATIKEYPNIDALTLDNVAKGDFLFLEDENLSNGYYRVTNPKSQIAGWIYKTLVKRYGGAIPSDINIKIDNIRDLVVDVIDVGGGLCNVLTLPNGKFILYDAGHYDNQGLNSLRQVQEIIPTGTEIEIMILSHTDADHIGAAGLIIKNYKVKKILHTGYEKSMISTSESTKSYKSFMKALHNPGYSIENINLNVLDSIIMPGSKGTIFEMGGATIRFLCGFGKPLDEWELSEQSKKLNAVSIVMTVEYKGHSVLFGGDAVGKIDNVQPVATEKFLLKNAAQYLDVDVVIAPHHGADNASSNEFIEATSPLYVIFSAGHAHEHPRASAVQRYLEFGVNIDNILRTDRGDDEEDDREWAHLKIESCKDTYDDDDVRIIISSEGILNVNYLNLTSKCEN